MRRPRILPGWLVLGALLFRLAAAGQGNEVVVVYNTRLAESLDVAEHYADVATCPPTKSSAWTCPKARTSAARTFGSACNGRCSSS